MSEVTYFHCTVNGLHVPIQRRLHAPPTWEWATARQYVQSERHAMALSAGPVQRDKMSRLSIGRSRLWPDELDKQWCQEIRWTLGPLNMPLDVQTGINTRSDHTLRCRYSVFTPIPYPSLYSAPTEMTEPFTDGALETCIDTAGDGCGTDFPDKDYAGLCARCKLVALLKSKGHMDKAAEVQVRPAYFQHQEYNILRVLI